MSKKSTLLKTQAQAQPEQGAEMVDEPYEGASGYADYVAAAQEKAQQGKTPPKDPTRRMPWFFAVTLILSIIIAVVIAYGPQLAELAAPILSLR